MGSGFGISIFKTSDEMSDFLVAKWRETAEGAIVRRGFFSVALSGGKTPADFYRRLAVKELLPWQKTHIFMADERFVPFSDKDSNFGMLYSFLLDKVNLPKQNIHAVATDLSSPSDAARRYEHDMKLFFGLSGHGLPVFDLICLGLGEDGHTASLFPGAAEAEVPLMPEKIRLAIPVEHEYVKHARVSLTLPVINNASNVLFIVAGRNKATIVKRVVADRDQGFPAARVEPSHGSLMFLLDEEAASMLDKP